MTHKEDQSYYRRITSVQLQFFQQFSMKHPEMHKRKMLLDDGVRIKALWEELATQLNRLKGPKRTADKWRQKFVHWKNQRRCRARKIKRLTQDDTFMSDENYDKNEGNCDFMLESNGESEMYEAAPMVNDQYYDPEYAKYAPFSSTALQELVSMNEKLSASLPATESLDNREIVVKSEVISCTPPLELPQSIATPIVPAINGEKLDEGEEDESSNINMPSPQSTLNSNHNQQRNNCQQKPSIADIFMEAVKLWKAAEERQEQRHLETMKMKKTMVVAMESIGNEMKSLGNAMKNLTESIHDKMQNKPLNIAK